MKKFLVTFIFFCPFIPFTIVEAQKIEYGITAAGTINFIFLRGDFDIQDGAKFKPALSYNVGGFVKTNSKLFNLRGSVEYLRIKNKLNLDLRDLSGLPLGESEPSIINHCIVINTIGTINIIKGCYLGIGVSGSILLKSSLKVNADLNVAGTKIDYAFNNNSYRRVAFSIPVIVGYDFNRISIFTRFNIGIMNRLNGDSYVKEIDNPLFLGIGYKINKRN